MAGAKTTGPNNLLTYTTTAQAGETQDKVLAVVLTDSSGTTIAPTVGGLTDTQLRATPVPVSVADGADVAQGTTTDAATANTVIGRLKKIVALLPAALGVLGGLKVEVLPASTGTQTSVGNSVTSVTVLAANASRRGATIYNDDTAATLRIKFGATASSTSFVYAIPAGGYYEVPFGYTGIIDGIASAATGSARVTELT